MNVAIDTNVLAYAEGLHDDSKRDGALQLLQSLPPESTFIPVQALGELFSVLVRKARWSKAKAGKVSRVQVAIAHLDGKKCRFVRSGGRLSGVRSCSKPIYVRARGAKRWSLSLRGTFPAGRYRAWVRGRDARGNVEKRGKRNTVTFRIA